MLNFIKNLLRPVKLSFSMAYSKQAYSQEGEDMILNRYFEGKKKGFFIDVGAHHPWRFSNTFFFYKRGWRGINLDPMPGSMKLFNKKRPYDINLELGISEYEADLDYHIFKEPALNGFSEEMKDEYLKHNQQFIKTVKLKTFPLKSILNTYLKKNQTIDFMSIDVEGLDLEVLKSNDWQKYRPYLVLVESNSQLEEIVECPIYQYMAENDYSLISKTAKTFFYMDKSQKS